jgi:N-methylhydantoinase B/oxoprolinase/acetone carboxylase alpha subunit
MHIPDVFIIKPVHCEGELVSFAATTAHHAASADASRAVRPVTAPRSSRKAFGSVASAVRGGGPVEDVFKIIRANVQVP